MNTRIHRAGDGGAASGSSDPAARPRVACAPKAQVALVVVKGAQLSRRGVQNRQVSAV
jgi:hypothetical protein